MKNKLKKKKKKIKQKLKCLKPTHFSLTSPSEFVVTSYDSVFPNCLCTVLLGGGIVKSLLIKNCAKAVSEEIQIIRSITPIASNTTTGIREEEYE